MFADFTGREPCPTSRGWLGATLGPASGSPYATGTPSCTVCLLSLLSQNTSCPLCLFTVGSRVPSFVPGTLQGFSVCQTNQCVWDPVLWWHLKSHPLRPLPLRSPLCLSDMEAEAWGSNTNPAPSCVTLAKPLGLLNPQFIFLRSGLWHLHLPLEAAVGFRWDLKRSLRTLTGCTRRRREGDA